MTPNPYIPRPWQLPHLIATPVGGTVLIVERCKYQSPNAKSVVHDELKDLWALVSQDIEVDGRINLELAECQDDRFNVTPWFACPLGPVGTVLACKERWALCHGERAMDGRGGHDNDCVFYDATKSCSYFDWATGTFAGEDDFFDQAMVDIHGGGWKAARIMPLKYCRLFYRTTAIDLRRVDTINSKRHDEVFRAGYPFGYDVKTLDEPPWNTFKRRWLADNPGATWGDWAWFITEERTDQC